MLTVEHSGPLPDRFQERLETIVTGRVVLERATEAMDSLLCRIPPPGTD